MSKIFEQVHEVDACLAHGAAQRLRGSGAVPQRSRRRSSNPAAAPRPDRQHAASSVFSKRSRWARLAPVRTNRSTAGGASVVNSRTLQRRGPRPWARST